MRLLIEIFGSYIGDLFPSEFIMVASAEGNR